MRVCWCTLGGTAACGHYSNNGGGPLGWMYYPPPPPFPSYPTPPYSPPYTPTVPVSSGWVCPKCGMVHAPSVAMCPCCISTKVDTKIAFGSATEKVEE